MCEVNNRKATVTITTDVILPNPEEKSCVIETLEYMGLKGVIIKRPCKYKDYHHCTLFHTSLFHTSLRWGEEVENIVYLGSQRCEKCIQASKEGT